MEQERRLHEQAGREALQRREDLPVQQGLGENAVPEDLVRRERALEVRQHEAERYVSWRVEADNVVLLRQVPLDGNNYC